MDSACNDNIGGDPPVLIRHHLEVVAAHGISPAQLLQWYHDITQRHVELCNTHPGQHGVVPAVLNNAVRYCCPWCKRSIKHSKDFIRHVKETCFVTQEYHCPVDGCSKKFSRPYRFKEHCESDHRCGGGSCEHQQQALVPVTQNPIPACGFCGDTFDLDIDRYLGHLIVHYREGATLDAWDPERHVPSATEALPPQVELSQALEGHTAISDFSALLSAYGSQVVEQPSSASAPPYYGSAVLSSATYSAPVPTDLVDMELNLRHDLNSSEHVLDPSLGSGPDDGLYYLAQSASQQHIAVDETLYGVGGHASDGFPLPPNEYDFTEQTTAQATECGSSTTTQACARMASAAELESSFDSVEHMMPPFNVTPPLPPPEGHRRTLSARLLRALQSLS